MNICDENKCCGCGLCGSICPKDAISMKENKEGFIVPVIDKNKCINCGLCKKMCIMNSDYKFNTPNHCYAAHNTNITEQNRSASGGVFFALAKEFIKEGGYVCGSIMEVQDHDIKIKHIISNKEEDLIKMQGSKYVQSEISHVLNKINELINNGKKVLFCGTPCQNAAVKKKVGENYNLYLVDLICHGVPSEKMFNDYIKINLNKGEKIKQYLFRDKSIKKGFVSKKIIIKKGKEIAKYKPAHLESFYHLFLKSYIYRENCYSCLFAKEERISDITIGDYWGIKDVFKDVLNDDIHTWSCILVNNQHGQDLINSYGINMRLLDSKLSDIAKYNMQLRRPSPCPNERKEIMEQYTNDGYKSVEKFFRNKIGKIKFYGLSLRFYLIKK